MPVVHKNQSLSQKCVSVSNVALNKNITEPALAVLKGGGPNFPLGRGAGVPLSARHCLLATRAALEHAD